jgi:hypothetical protein
MLSTVTGIAPEPGHDQLVAGREKLDGGGQFGATVAPPPDTFSDRIMPQPSALSSASWVSRS